MAALPPGSSFDRALNLINRAVGMLREGNNLESQSEGSSSSDVQNLPAASTSSSSGSLPRGKCFEWSEWCSSVIRQKMKSVNIFY